MAMHKDITGVLAGGSQELAWPGRVMYNAALPWLSVQLCWGVSPSLFRWVGKDSATNFSPFSSSTLGRPQFTLGILTEGAEHLPSCRFKCVVLLQRVS